MVSKSLQKKEVNIPTALKLIDNVKEFLNGMRSENGLNSIITDARELAEKLEVPPEFKTEAQVRPRKTKRQFSYESEDEPAISISGKESFKVDFFFVVLDKAINSLEERFELLQNHGNHFQFLYDLKLVEQLNKEELKEKCNKLEGVLTASNDKDINGEDLFKEIVMLAPLLPKDSSAEATLSYLTKSGMIDIFPNVFIALRILITLPVSVASGERSFSKLKIIKSYLRSATSQERLSGLATLAIENDVLNSLDTDLVLRDFAKTKARRVQI